ncbi:MAG: hypothetical protein GY900_10585 [Actinomycetia bacterium]|nr:hypothetical protein [Actinomycetes bacterium]
MGTIVMKFGTLRELVGTQTDVAVRTERKQREQGEKLWNNFLTQSQVPLCHPYIFFHLSPLTARLEHGSCGAIGQTVLGPVNSMEWCFFIGWIVIELRSGQHGDMYANSACFFRNRVEKRHQYALGQPLKLFAASEMGSLAIFPHL